MTTPQLTAQQENELREAVYSNKMSVAAAARHFGISTWTAYAIAGLDCNTASRKAPIELTLQIRDRIAAGEKVKDLSEELKIPRSTIYYWCRKLRLTENVQEVFNG